MNLLIIGKNGQLGFELCRQAAEKGFSAVSCDLPAFDITDPDAIRDRIDHSGCDIAINAAAYTAVDKAEKEIQKAFAVNSEAPFILALECAKRSIPLIHVSTDYVFDGCKKGPYLESDPIRPMSVYGKSKAAGEDRIRDVLEMHFIIRTAWLYGEHGSNFVKTMLRLGTERESVDVVSDQFGCPTRASDLAEAILSISDRTLCSQKPPWGTYHYAGKGIASWHEFAEAIFMEAGKYIELRVKEVNAITTEQYPTPAARPRNSVLDCTKIIENFNIEPKPWRDSLKKTIRNLCQS